MPLYTKRNLKKSKHFSHFHLKRKYQKIGIYEIGVRFETCLMESMSNVSIKTSISKAFPVYRILLTFLLLTLD